MTVGEKGMAATSFVGRVAKLLLVPLMSTTLAFAETEEMEDRRSYVTMVGYKVGYNMGPYSKNGIMKGMPIPPNGGFKWGRCNSSMLSPSFVSGWPHSWRQISQSSVYGEARRRSLRQAVRSSIMGLASA
jgi:hypothetical protein